MKNFTKKKITRKLILTLLIVGLLISLTGCDFFAAALFSINGSVVDARDANLAGVSTVTITLTPVGTASDGSAGDTYSGTTGSDGSFTIASISSGEYTLTAVKDGWFIPQQKVTVAGLMSTIPTITAFKLKPADAYGLSFITTWNTTVNDVDIYMTYPTAWTDGEMTTPYDDFGTNPQKVYWNSKYAGVSTDPSIYMDRDDRDGYGPETVNIRFVPHLDTPTGVTTVDSTTDTNGLYTAFGLSTGISYQWLGTCELYLDAYSSGTNLSSGTASAAEAVVYAIQTLPKNETTFDGTKPDDYSETDLKYNYLGFYKIPEFTTIKSASVLRVNMFLSDDGTDQWESFQIVPDVRVFPAGTTTFKSLENPSIVGVRGRLR